MSGTSERPQDDAVAFWNAMAPRYFAGAGRKTPALMDQLLVGAPAASSIVDLACGPGLTTLRVAAAFPDADILGVDISPAMLAQARVEAPGLRFELGRDTDLPVPDASVDLLVCSLGLMLFPDAGAALREAARVLRPGGQARFGVWGREEATNFPTFGVTLAKRLGFAIPDPPRSNFHLGEPEALAAAAEGAGLQLLETRRYDLRFDYTDPAEVCRDLGLSDHDPGPLKELVGDGWADFQVEARREAARLLEAGGGALVMESLIGTFG